VKIIKRRIGRLNVTEFFDNGIIRKISSLEEQSRPKRLLREAIVLEMARSRGVLVPELLAYGRDSIDREYLETKMISGSTLVSMADRVQKEVFATIGGQLLRLRACFAGYGWLNGETKKGEYQSWRQFLIDFYERYSARIVAHDLSKVLEHCHMRDLIQESVSEPPEPYIIHRDIKPRNVIKDNSGFIWILDWENALLGDPLFDVAQFAANFGHGEQWRSVVSGYGLNIRTRTYALYEVIALIGVVAFCQKYCVPVARRRERLKQRLADIQSHP